MVPLHGHIFRRSDRFFKTSITFMYCIFINIILQCKHTFSWSTSAAAIQSWLPFVRYTLKGNHLWKLPHSKGKHQNQFRSYLQLISNKIEINSLWNANYCELLRYLGCLFYLHCFCPGKYIEYVSVPVHVQVLRIGYLLALQILLRRRAVQISSCVAIRPHGA